LVTTFGKGLFVFLQTRQNAAITRLYGLTDSFHIFDAGKRISFCFPPAHQPLPHDLLAGWIQSLDALHDTPSSFVSHKGIGAVLLDLCITLHFRNLSGTAVAWNR
jgi:hypothetical protein